MAAVVKPSLSPHAIASFAEPTEERKSLVLPGYTWAHYLSLDDLFQDSRVRVLFLDNTIEIMSPISNFHEERKSTIGNLVEVWCVHRRIRFVGRGSATLTVQDEAGGEPDESYCIGEKKDIPDLAIEVAVTSGGIDKLEFYQRLPVKEVWIWQYGKIKVFVLDADSKGYTEMAESAVLPGIDLPFLAECSSEENTFDAVMKFKSKLEDS